MRVAKNQIQFLNKYIYYLHYIHKSKTNNKLKFLTTQMRHSHVLCIYLDSLYIQKRTSCFFLHSVIARNMILFRIRHFSFLLAPRLMSLALRSMGWNPFWNRISNTRAVVGFSNPWGLIVIACLFLFLFPFLHFLIPWVLKHPQTPSNNSSEHPCFYRIFMKYLSMSVRK